MGRMCRLPHAILVLLAALPGFARGAETPEARVGLKNAEAMAVSVHLGTDNGVGEESDFAAQAADNGAVLLYPAELYRTLFWSQPLSPEAFSRLEPGDVVRPSVLSREEHDAVRKEGRARAAERTARREASRREAARKEIDALRERKARLEERRDALDERVADAEKTLADEEGRLDWISSSEERDIDRSLQSLQEYADRRDELQEQRNALSGQRPYPSGEIHRLSAEIRRLNDRIASERDAVRNARDRKRSARSSFLARKQEWQTLVAERRQATNEIRSLDRKIRELEEK